MNSAANTLPETKTSTAHLLRGLGVLLLLGYGMFLIISGSWFPSLSSLVHGLSPKTWLTQFATACGFETAKWFVMGTAVVGLSRCFSDAPRLWWNLLAGTLIAVVVGSLREMAIPNLLSLGLAIISVTMGVWLTSRCLQGWKAAAWAMVTLCIAFVVLGLATAGVAMAAFSNEPPDMTFATPSAEDKVRLKQTILGGDHFSEAGGTLVLSQQDLNLALAMAAEKSPLKGNAKVEFGEQIELVGYLQMPARWPGGRYVEFHAAGNVTVNSGQPSIDLEQVNIGSVPIPALLAEFVCEDIVEEVRKRPDAEEVAQSIELFEIDSRELRLQLAGNAKQKLKAAFKRYLGEDATVVAATKSQLEFLTSVGRLREGREFETLVSLSFGHAAKKTAEGGDAVTENRAAILALSILVGHEKLRHFVGDVTNEEMFEKVQSLREVMRLRGRNDLARHFTVSAGLTLMFNEGFSDSVGLFKEEIDSAKGGSGFSFVDLLADRAGTKFALAATRDKSAAVRVQELVGSAKFSVDDIFPSIDGLPEGLTEEEYRELRAGGQQEQLLQQIERRLSECPTLNAN